MFTRATFPKTYLSRERKSLFQGPFIIDFLMKSLVSVRAAMVDRSPKTDVSKFAIKYSVIKVSRTLKITQPIERTI